SAVRSRIRRQNNLIMALKVISTSIFGCFYRLVLKAKQSKGRLLEIPSLVSVLHLLHLHHCFQQKRISPLISVNEFLVYNRGLNIFLKGGRCLAWYDASLGRWRSLVRIRPVPLQI